MTEAPLYTPQLRDQIRIALEHGAVWRPIMWLEVAQDGSVYIGPRIKEISVAKRGSVTPINGQARVRYSEGEAVGDPKAVREGRVSFHPSGLINAGGKRLWRPAFRSLRSQHNLCLVLFQNPASYHPIAAARRRDVCLRYPLDPGHPLQATVSIAPASSLRLVEQAGAIHQLNLLFYFAGAREMPDFFVQVVLSHGAAGPWPPLTYLVYGGKP